MRLIDADALIPMMKYATTDNEIGVFPIKIGFDAIVKVINDTPTADVVERKKGKWTYNSPVTVKCDQCGYVIGDWDASEYAFCPHCGSDMRGRSEEE